MKRTVAVVMAILMCVFLAGCSPLHDLIDILYAQDVIREEESKPRFAFSNGELFVDKSETYLPASDFDQVTSPYAEYRSDVYYNALSPEEQNIYIAFEYALENSYSNVLVDSALAEDTETLVKVLNHLSLDSPLLEQNLRYEVGTFTSSFPVNILGLYDAYANFEGFYITVENFDSELWAKKLEALETAKKRVEDLPSGLSDWISAEELYLSLAQSVEYYDYEGEDSDKVFPYLYDALIIGKTHCDGHANALSLLLRLAGIEACEKNYSSQDPDEAGHTWVTFEIDGEWYNIDSTNSDMIPKKQCSMRSGFYFAFSDDMRLFPEDYDEVTPVCEKSKYMNPDASVYDLSGNSFSDSVVYGYDMREPDWALILVYRNNSYLLERQIQRCANHTYSTVYWMTIDLANGATAVIVYEKGLF